MPRLIVLFIWILCASVVFQTNKKPIFGVKISIAPNSQVCTYACYMYDGRVLTQRRIVDEQSFIKIVSGEWPTIYNPKRVNLFEEKGVDCGMVLDSVTMEKVGVCDPLDSLWKIRFGTYPFKHRAELGWSNKYLRPSPKQEKYIFERYGVDHVDLKFFLDTNFWRLLGDVKDTSWINNYKGLY